MTESGCVLTSEGEDRSSGRSAKVPSLPMILGVRSKTKARPIFCVQVSQWA